MKSEYSKSGSVDDLIHEISIENLVEGIGELNIDIEIFDLLNSVITKIGKNDDVSNTMRDVQMNQNIKVNFWILAHLANHEKITDTIRTGLFNQVENKLESIIKSDGEFERHYGETIGFLYRLNEYHPEVAKRVIDNDRSFWDKLINIMEYQKDGNGRQVGL